MNRILLPVRPAAAVGVLTVASSLAPAQAPRLAAIPIAEGLTMPVAIAAAPGDPTRLFIAELSGSGGVTNRADIRILDLRTNTLNKAPFLSVTVRAGGEGGLLGLAFDPAFQSNGWFYIHHSSAQGSRIARYTISATDPNFADSASRVEVLLAAQTRFSHQGGWLEFGPDGFLYFSIGELDVPAHAQDLTNLFGKVGRIDVRTLPYTIPPSNPYVGSATARQEIWALGLRNPWRCSIDSATGDVWIGDVGEGFHEEINVAPVPASVPAPAPNFGWPCSNGSLNNCPPGTPVTPPVFSYPLSPSIPTSQYVVGGRVYRGAAIPFLRGTYFFWRRGPNTLWSMRYDGTAISELTDRTIEMSPSVGFGTLMSFNADVNGEIYMPAMTPGWILKIVPRCAANCDGSTTEPVLDAADLACFLNLFAQNDPYANCDSSSVSPALNVQDFACFLNRYAAGCS